MYVNSSNRTLSITDIQQLSSIINCDQNQLIYRLKQSTLNTFTVSQLKDIIKWFKHKISDIDNSIALQFRHTGIYHYCCYRCLNAVYQLFLFFLLRFCGNLQVVKLNLLKL